MLQMYFIHTSMVSQDTKDAFLLAILLDETIRILIQFLSPDHTFTKEIVDSSRLASYGVFTFVVWAMQLML